MAAYSPTPFALTRYINEVAYTLLVAHGVRFAALPIRAAVYAHARSGQAFAAGLPHASAALAIADELSRGCWRRSPLPACALAA